ncbi:MAG: NTP transferase domain-containing protein [Bacteroidetes bacterium]|nr:NTP transferase domain-containing protein [Bacteroidota bacterium]
MTHIEPENVGAIILAAGNSKRMNSWKPFLKLDENSTFLEKIMSTFLHWGCQEIVVVINKDVQNQHEYFVHFPEKVTCVLNEHLEFERFYSVKLGLQAIEKSDFCFIQNVDNPFIDGHILDLIYQHRSNEEWVSPVFENQGGHPVLLNLENINCISHWPVDSANLKEVLNTMECKKVEMQDDRVLVNINNPEEYAKYVTEWN